MPQHIAHHTNALGVRPGDKANHDQVNRLRRAPSNVRMDEVAHLLLERGPHTPERRHILNQFIEVDARNGFRHK